MELLILSICCELERTIAWKCYNYPVRILSLFMLQYLYTWIWHALFVFLLFAFFFNSFKQMPGLNFVYIVIFLFTIPWMRVSIVLVQVLLLWYYEGTVSIQQSSVFYLFYIFVFILIRRLKTILTPQTGLKRNFEIVINGDKYFCVFFKLPSADFWSKMIRCVINGSASFNGAP